ncbi:hypothetical protein HPB50_007490 [Hyalomma asiaticum]|uniref:Uncharacterized protein n=1 Tax=Hyalomma asiaticum TaxID=266040 RepID=A0ACB7S7N7_HYAAI|nr:hypothetical protein HPB50_007490 [Hyalomma asiaticum]
MTRSGSPVGLALLLSWKSRSSLLKRLERRVSCLQPAHMRISAVRNLGPSCGDHGPSSGIAGPCDPFVERPVRQLDPSAEPRPVTGSPGLESKGRGGPAFLAARPPFVHYRLTCDRSLQQHSQAAPSVSRVRKRRRPTRQSGRALRAAAEPSIPQQQQQLQA